MSALERLLVAVLVVIALLVGAGVSVVHYGTTRYSAGYAAAVAAGRDARDAQATAHLAIESGLRTQLLDRDADALRKEQEHAQALADAQRRVRAGTDRLRCPASAVQPSPAPDSGSAAAGPTADPGGPDIVPEVAAEILGDGSAVAGLVRRYERVVERFEACRAVNAK